MSGQSAAEAGFSFTEQPIAWAHTGDGEFPYRATVAGTELVVRVNDFPAEPLYSLLVDGQVQLDLEDWPACWARPGTPSHLLRAAGAAQVRRGRLDPIVIAAWAHELCLLPPGGAAGAAAALGVSGTLEGGNGHWLVSPPPSGSTRFSISDHGGDVSTVEVALDVPGPSRADLDAILGPGRPGVRIHYDQPHPVCYAVTVPDAPYTCDVFAYFPTQPAPEATAARVLLRRQRSPELAGVQTRQAGRNYPAKSGDLC